MGSGLLVGGHPVSRGSPPRLLFRHGSRGAYALLACAALWVGVVWGFCAFVAGRPGDFFNRGPLLFAFVPATFFAGAFLFSLRSQSGLLIDLQAGEVRVLGGLAGKGASRRWPLERFTAVSLREDTFDNQFVVTLTGQDGLQLELPRRASERRAWRDFLRLGTVLGLPLTDYTTEPPVHTTVEELTTPLVRSFGPAAASTAELLEQVGPPPAGSGLSAEVLPGGGLKVVLRPDPEKRPGPRYRVILTAVTVGTLLGTAYLTGLVGGRWHGWFLERHLYLLMILWMVVVLGWVAMLGSTLPVTVTVAGSRVRLRQGPLRRSLPAAQVTSVLRRGRGGFSIITTDRALRFPPPMVAGCFALDHEEARWFQQVLIGAVTILTPRPEGQDLGTQG